MNGDVQSPFNLYWASTRIRIENTLAKVKKYKVLAYKMSECAYSNSNLSWEDQECLFLNMHHMHWVIGAALTNCKYDTRFAMHVVHLAEQLNPM